MRAGAPPGRLGTFLELTKFPISFVSVLSAGAGQLACRRGLDGGLGTLAAGTLLMAMGASALNEAQEWRVDSLMERTRHRPVPRGALAPGAAAAIALGLAAAGFLLLLRVHGWTPALLGLLAMAWYNGLYTPLKRISAFAVVPGSVIGALPPAMGWTAAGGSPGDPACLALCFLLFVWQVPHFWLLALLHGAGYRQAGLPTLHRHFTERQILRLVFTWTCATVVACALLPGFGCVRGGPAMALLAGAGLWLAASFLPLLGAAPGARQLRKAFLEINAFLLLVLAAVALDALG